MFPARRLLLHGCRSVLLCHAKSESNVELRAGATIAAEVIHLQWSSFEQTEQLKAQVQYLRHLSEDPDPLLEREIHECLDVLVEESRRGLNA